MKQDETLTFVPVHFTHIAPLVPEGAKRHFFQN